MSFNEFGEIVQDDNNNNITINSQGDVKDVSNGEIQNSNNDLIINSQGDVKDVSSGEIPNSNNDLIINSQGDVKDTLTGKITTKEPITNDIDLSKYDETLNPLEGSIYEKLANEQRTESIVVATHKDEKIESLTPEQQKMEETRAQVIYDATHGSDRATFRDENMKFTGSQQPGARLHFTQNQIESARKEMEKAELVNLNIRIQKYLEERDPNKSPEEQLIELSTLMNERNKIEIGFFQQLVNKDQENQKTSSESVTQPQPEQSQDITDSTVEQPPEPETEATQEEHDTEPTNFTVDQPIPSDFTTNESTTQQPEQPIQPDEILTPQPEQTQEPVQPQEPVIIDVESVSIPENNSGQSTSTTTSTPESTPMPNPVSSDAEAIRDLQERVRELSGENTPEQRSLALNNELVALESKLTSGGLTDAQKISYFDILKQKETIDKQIQTATQESERKRKTKEKYITGVAVLAGIGVAVATPAVTAAAAVAITLGGRIVGKHVFQSLGDKMRAKSNSMKYEPRTGKTADELFEMDQKQKRTQWWANRFGEVGAIFIGGSTGYGIGTLFEGIIGKDIYIGMNKPVPNVPIGPEATLSQASAETTQPISDVTPNPEVNLNQGLEATLNQPSIENWIPEETFNASDFGWNFNDMGWLGDKVYLTNAGGGSGELQGDFFRELAKLVPKEKLMGQSSGNIVNEFLRAAYGNMNPAQAAQKAAEMLLK